MQVRAILRHFALSAALLTACAGHITKKDLLVMAIREFNDGIRWGKIDISATHLPLPSRKLLAERFGRVEDDLEVVDYDLQRIDVAPGGKNAVVRVDMAWSLKRRGIVDRTVLEQIWEEQSSGWFMTKQTRIKGVALPIFED